jgi:peptide/nickel transport system permease protein
MAGFWGDDGLRIARISAFTAPIFIFLAFFYGFFRRSYTLIDALSDSMSALVGQLIISFFIFIFVLTIGYFLIRPIVRGNSFLSKTIAIPIDLVITRIIEVLLSIPALIIILAVLAITRPSIYNVMIIIGLMGWPSIARFVRAELLRIRRLEYIEAATALGFDTVRILFRHALPNALAPVFIVLAFGVADAILTESVLSFMGIGSIELTWGKLLDLARDEKSNWWLAVFPGFAIFITVTLFNLIGEGLTDALDPRLKN